MLSDIKKIEQQIASRNKWIFGTYKADSKTEWKRKTKRNKTKQNCICYNNNNNTLQTRNKEDKYIYKEIPKQITEYI